MVYRTLTFAAAMSLAAAACLDGGVRISESLPETLGEGIGPVGDSAGGDSTPTDGSVGPDSAVPDVPATDGITPDATASCPPGARSCDDAGGAILQCNDAGTGWEVSSVCASGAVCADAVCVPSCSPKCGDRLCGPDSCGGQCGFCDDGEVCNDAGLCACIPECDGQQCGGDGCGGSCGLCADGSSCVQGQCTGCTPQCQGKECGDDGCGGECGECGDQGICLGSVCLCAPACAGKQCGPDGCGGDCGLCDADQSCSDAGTCVCLPTCAGKECGDDGCGGTCGICEDAQTCTPDHQCEAICVPACAGKACGGDGCGDSCGTCAPGETCNSVGSCVGAPDVFTAVYVEDAWSGQCSSFNSSGADIRGARLRTASNQQIGFWESVNTEVGADACQNDYTDPDAVLGQPNESYMALQGGWIVGAFPDATPIESGMRIRVYELDGQVGGSTESYSVYLATDIDCPYQVDAKSTCMKLLTDSANGTTNIIVP